MMANTPKQAGKEAIKKLGWWGSHRFLLLRRFTQLSILFMFVSGPLFNIWVLRGNYSSSKFLDVIPATDPLIMLQSMVTGYWPVFTVLLGALIIVAVYALVAGKLYCSWVCPFNMVTDLAAWLRRKLNIQSSLSISNKLRYAVLVGVLSGSAITGVLVWEWLNPISIMGRGMISIAGEMPKVWQVFAHTQAQVTSGVEIFGNLNVPAPQAEDGGEVSVSFWRLLTFGFGAGIWMLVAIFFFDLLVVKNGWCGHLCPVGALYGIIGSKGMVYIDAKHRIQCTNCMDCIHVCPEPQVLPKPLFGKQESTQILSRDCIRCGRCIDICPEKVFSITTYLFQSSKGGK